MDATHIFSLPMHTNPQRLDPCINRDWVALPLSKTSIGIWKISNFTSDSSHTKVPPIELTGHDREIKALAFSSRNKNYLASASTDKILVWDLDIQHLQDIKPKQFFSSPGEANCLCFNNSEDIIAVGVESQILLLQSRQKEPLAILEVHRAMVTGVMFCPHYSSTLVSISDDRTFCVWNIEDISLLYQSTQISSASPISIAMNLLKPQVSIGTTDGSLKVFDLTDGHDFRCLANINVARLLAKEISKNASENSKGPKGPTIVNKHGRKSITESSSTDDFPSFAESSESILSIQYAYYTQVGVDPLTSNQFPSIVGRSGAGDIVEDAPPSICVVTSNAVIRFDASSLQIKQIIDFQQTIKSLSFCGSKTIGSVALAGIDQCGPLQMTVIAEAMFEKRTDVIMWKIHDTDLDCLKNTIKVDSLNEVTVVPSSAMLDSSPLRSDMLPNVSSQPITKGDIATGKKKPTSSMNQPLTFKSKIKSSGYTQAPRTTMFKPETSKSKLLGIREQQSTKPSKPTTSFSKTLKTSYDTNKGPPNEYCDTFVADHQSTAVQFLKFSGDGSGLACALSNKSALILKSPYSKQISIPLTGHDATVNSIQWSNDSALVITASNDKKAFVWSKSGGNPLMTLDYIKGSKTSDPLQNNQKSNTAKVSDNSNKLFSKEIKHAQFYFMDKFILLTHGSTLGLYKYNVGFQKDDLKSYTSTSRYKNVASWETTSSSFTFSMAANSFLSYIVICATSGRNLEIYDLNKAELCHTFTDCHSRPAHCVAINEGSVYALQPSDAHNVIATTALTDPIKLWDLRSKSNIQALQGHLNNAHACQIAFSPCGNYLAAGSENKTTYIYDLRKGTYVERLRGHTDVITSVAFHPAHPLLATGSLDSKVLFYKAS